MYVKLIVATLARPTPFGLGKYGVFHDDGLPVVDVEHTGRYAQVVFDGVEGARQYVERDASRYGLRVRCNGVYAWTNWYTTREVREAWIAAWLRGAHSSSRTEVDLERIDPRDVPLD